MLVKSVQPCYDQEAMQISLRFLGLVFCIVATQSLQISVVGFVAKIGSNVYGRSSNEAFRTCTKRIQRPRTAEMSTDLYQPCWKSFINFNEGTWKGKALHISPDSGEYIHPYVTSEYTVDVKHDGSRQAATFTCSSDIPGMLQTEILASDGFDATEDGAYSLDHEMTSFPGIAGPPMRLAIEMSLPVGADERVRCSILYDSAGRLSRIILFEEARHTAASPPSYRAPLALADIVGPYAGDALSRRTWRLGGGNVRFRCPAPAHSPLSPIVPLCIAHSSLAAAAAAAAARGTACCGTGGSGCGARQSSRTPPCRCRADPPFQRPTRMSE